MSSYREIINGTLRSIGDKMKEVGESSGVKDIYSRGAERAKSYARVAKLTMAINGEAEELRKVYAEIGKLCYEQNEAAPDPIYEGLFARVGELRASLKSKEDEIRARREEFEAAQAEKNGDIEVEIGNFEDVVNATENDGSGQ